GSLIGQVSRLVAHEVVLGDRGPRTGADDVGRAALGVDDSLTIGRQDRLATRHVPGDAVPSGDVVLDGEGAQPRRRTGFSGCEVGLLAYEVRRLHPGTIEAGFDRVVLRLELGPHEPIALLQAGTRPVHARAHRDHAVVLTGVPEHVPHLRAPLDRDIDLP